MIVYRVCKEDEINLIFANKDFLDVGSNFSCSEISTHKYNENKKYLHFFQKKDSILYLGVLKGRYICTYDIPEDILECHRGIGYYYNYFNYRNLNAVEEYAIETDLIKMSFLKSVGYIKEDIDFDDFIDDYDTANFIDVIYDSNNEKKLSLGWQRKK